VDGGNPALRALRSGHEPLDSVAERVAGTGTRTPVERDPVPPPPLLVTADSSELSAGHPAVLESKADRAASASVAAGVYGALVTAASAPAVDRGRVGFERTSASEQGTLRVGRNVTGVCFHSFNSRAAL
jgi:hypothetical protein